MRIFWINYSAIVGWKLSYWISCQQWHCSNLIWCALLLECTVTDEHFLIGRPLIQLPSGKSRRTRIGTLKQQVARKEVAASRSIISVMFVLKVGLLEVWKLPCAPDTNELGDLNSGVVIRQQHEKRLSIAEDLPCKLSCFSKMSTRLRESDNCLKSLPSSFSKWFYCWQGEKGTLLFVLLSSRRAEY